MSPVCTCMQPNRPLLPPNADVFGSGRWAAALNFERSQQNAIRWVGPADSA